MIPAEIKRKLITQLSNALNTTVTFTEATLLTGGCINNAVKLKTDKGLFFVKWNINAKTNMFQSEYRGLKVFGFHPIHVFLNTENMERYEGSRSLHQCPSELLAKRGTDSGGSRELLKTLLGGIS